MEFILKEYIRHALKASLPEAAAWKKNLTPDEQKTFSTETDALAKLKEFSEFPNVFMHFATVDKLGINPKSRFSTTPIGIYAYPLTPSTLQQATSASGLPFAAEAPNLHVFSPKNLSRILNLQTYSETDLERDLAKIGPLSPRAQQSLTNPYFRNPGHHFWEVVKQMVEKGRDGYSNEYNSEESLGPVRLYPVPREWRALLVSLGYDGAVDNGGGIIHPNEPTQAVFFGANVVEPIYATANPFLKEKRKAEIEKVRLTSQYADLDDHAVDSEKFELKFKEMLSQAYSPLTVMQALDKDTLSKNLASAKIVWKYARDFKEPHARAKAGAILPYPLFLRFANDPSSVVRLAVAYRVPENMAASVLASEKQRPDANITIMDVLKKSVPRIQRRRSGEEIT